VGRSKMASRSGEGGNKRGGKKGEEGNGVLVGEYHAFHQGRKKCSLPMLEKKERGLVRGKGVWEKITDFYVTR